MKEIAAGGEKTGPEPTFMRVDLAVTTRRDPEPGREAAAGSAPPSPRPTVAELFRDHASFVWRVVAGHGVAASDVRT